MFANQMANTIAGFHLIIIIFLCGGLLFLAIPAFFRKNQPNLYYLWYLVSITTFISQIVFWGCPLTIAEAYFRPGSNAELGFLRFYLQGGGGDMLAIIPYALVEAIMLAVLWFGLTKFFAKKMKNSE